MGRRNFALNGMEGTFVHGVVGEGTSRASASRPRATCSRSTSHWARSPSVGTVWLSWLRWSGSPTIDLLLVDIQGAETYLLESALEQLRNGLVRYAVVSTHHHSISGSAVTHQKVRDLVTQAGGEILVEHSVTESHSGDGLVVACFRADDACWPITVSHARAVDSFFGELEPDCEAFRLEGERAREEHRRAEAAHNQVLADLTATSVRLELVTAQLANARFRQAEAERIMTAAEDAQKGLHRALDARQDELDAVRQSFDGVLGSTSWRVTAPLRKLANRSGR